MNDNIETKLQELVTAVYDSLVSREQGNTGGQVFKLHTNLVCGTYVADIGGQYGKGSTKEEALQKLLTIWTETARSRRDLLNEEFRELEAKIVAVGNHIDAIIVALGEHEDERTCEMCDNYYVVVNSMGDQRECDYCSHSYDDYLEGMRRLRG